MKVVLISCSEKAYLLAKKVEASFVFGGEVKLESAAGEPVEIIHGVKCGALKEISMEESVSGFVERYFDKVDGMIFFAATGIAVRCIAPCVRSKTKDPAVLVVDEMGKFCISLLSGHMGGANALAKRVSEMIGAVPVITTATDVENKFSVDDFARKYDLQIPDMNRVKQISANILQGHPIILQRFSYGCFYISHLEDTLLEEAGGDVVSDGEYQEADYGNRENSIVNKLRIGYEVLGADQADTVSLIPRILVLGIGCKKGTDAEIIGQAVKSCFEENALYEEGICKAASIDLKKEEEGLLEFCRERKIPFVTYSSQELNLVEGEFTASAFVEKVTGVSNVCERSAIAACYNGKGRLLVKKYEYHGVTVAVAVEDRDFCWGTCKRIL